MKATRPRGKARTKLVELIVVTDSSFRIVAVEQAYWRGKCIHCSSPVCVMLDGSTTATLEHIRPLCAGGSSDDPRNLALACSACNNAKGIRHDRKVGRCPRSDEVVAALLQKRAERWRDAAPGHLSTFNG
jgi:5-methylcytosine-specific restriction endonuclease McrA